MDSLLHLSSSDVLLDYDEDDYFHSALLVATLLAEDSLPAARAATPASTCWTPASTRSGRSSASGASGEYNAFSFVRKAVTWGGGGGRGGSIRCSRYTYSRMTQKKSNKLV